MSLLEKILESPLDCKEIQHPTLFSGRKTFSKNLPTQPAVEISLVSDWSKPMVTPKSTTSTADQDFPISEPNQNPLR